MNLFWPCTLYKGTIANLYKRVQVFSTWADLQKFMKLEAKDILAKHASWD